MIRMCDISIQREYNGSCENGHSGAWGVKCLACRTCWPVLSDSECKGNIANALIC